MSSLRELQQRFAHGILVGDVTPPALARASGARGDERMAVYRRSITANYRNAMAATYPTLRRIVGTSFFHAAVDAYAVAHPSQSGDLNEYGDAFGVFVERYPPAADLPYLPDVARLEWAIDEANRAADSRVDPDAVLDALARQAADALPGVRLAVEPSCRFVSSAFPLLRIWQVNQPDCTGDLQVDFRSGPDALRVRREHGTAGQAERNSGGIVIERLDAGDSHWLSALEEGVTLAEAIERARTADATFDLQPALHRFIGDGSIVGVGVSTSGVNDRR